MIFERNTFWFSFLFTLTIAELRAILLKDAEERGEEVSEDRGDVKISGAKVKECFDLDALIDEEIKKANLDFSLDKFQLASIQALASKQHVILSVPTGAGKMVVGFISHLVLKRVTNCAKGVTIMLFPLSDLISEVMRNCPFGLSIGCVTMNGGLQVNSEDNFSISHPLAELSSGDVSIIVGHPESFSSSTGRQILDSLQEKGLIMQIVIDEAHAGLASQWAGTFREGMLKAPARIRVKAQENAPVLAMSATLSYEDTKELMSNLDLSSDKTVVIRENPVLSNIKFSKLIRPNRFEGRSNPNNCKYEYGTLDMLKEIYLDKFESNLKCGVPNEKVIIFCYLQDGLKINDYLTDQLSDFASNEKNTPWVLNFADKGKRSKDSMRKRIDEGSLPLIIATHCMLYGLNLNDIDNVIMLKPFSSLSDFLQASGRAGRRLQNNTRKKSSFYLLYNEHDLATKHVTISVKNFVQSKSCLKEQLARQFDCDMKCNRQWCSSNCDG